jgi:hypothetical protein
VGRIFSPVRLTGSGNLMTEHSYHELFDDDSGMWLVLNEMDEFEAGPFREVEQAKAWIKTQYEYQERIDG